MNRRLRLVAIVLMVAALGGASLWLAGRDEPQVRAQLVARAGDTAGYRRADRPVPFRFPADHGPHPDYRTEWWYYTGNLETETGREFGFQLTFFRSALVPPAQRVARESEWAADQVYMAHFTVTDVAGRRFQAFERFSRGAAGLAGAQAAPYRVWLEDWSAEEAGAGTVRLRAAQDGIAIDLILGSGKGPILQGDRGYSRKGPEPGNASYYYSETRLATTGTIQAGGERYAVTGVSWLDREWSTSSLGAEQIGWDWFALQLDDGSEIMLYRLRRADGAVDPFSSGTFIALDGSTRPLAHDDFSITAGDTWRSPHSGAEYPARWTVSVPALGLELEIEPYLADQELDVSYAYWEGAVRFEGQRNGRPVRGRGYVELTGYAASMRDQL